MEELVEEVAMAIHAGTVMHEEDVSNPHRMPIMMKPWEDLQFHSHERYRYAARAAIEVVRNYLAAQGRWDAGALPSDASSPNQTIESMYSDYGGCD